MKYKNNWLNMAILPALLLFLASLLYPAVTQAAIKSIAINSTNFPDANFRHYVEENFDTDGNGELSFYERCSVSSIKLNKRKDIYSLQGIKYFYLLKELDCSEVPISTLDVSGNTELEYLNCGQNRRITSLDISHNTSLKEVYAYNNSLTELDTSHNPELTDFGCHGNYWTSLDFSKNPKLTYLNVGSTTRCPLKFIDLSQNTLLEKFKCDNTDVRSITLYSANLDTLSCENCYITKIDVTRCPKLKYLYASDNKLTSLDLSKNPNLTELRIDNNHLSGLDLSNQTLLSANYSKLGKQTITFDALSLDYPSFDADNIPATIPVSLADLDSFDINKAEDWKGCDPPVGKTLQLRTDRASARYTYDTGGTYYNNTQIKLECVIRYNMLYSLTLSKDSIAYDEANPTVTVKDNDENTLTKDIDYSLSFPKDKERKLGANTVSATGKDLYERTYIYRSFTITPGKLSNLKLSTGSVSYDGTGKKPTVTVTNRQNTKLIENIDYTVSYKNNINPGTATVTVTGINNYEGILSKEFKIEKQKLKKLTLGTTKYTYNGSAKLPSVKVTDSKNVVLKKGTDYTVTYKNNKNVGTATVTVTGKGKYTGNVTAKFTINPVATVLTKVTAEKKAFTAYWTKKSDQVTGYELQYSTNSKFPSNNSKTVKISSYKTVKSTVKKLSGKKKYYVRIRTYKTVNKTNYTSAWSKSKTVTTKK